MKNWYSPFIFISLVLNVQAGIDYFDDTFLSQIRAEKFGEKKIKCGVFSYSSNNNDYREKFIAKDFDDWKKICAKMASSFIYKNGKEEPPIQKEIEEYEKCRNLTSELTLALVVINQKKYENSQDFKAVRKTLEPVIKAAKKMNGSFLKKIKENFAEETAGRTIINQIKEILNKRVKELVDDFNDKIKTLGKKDIKKLSL